MPWSGTALRAAAKVDEEAPLAMGLPCGLSAALTFTIGLAAANGWLPGTLRVVHALSIVQSIVAL